ncbi:MAG: uridine kinase [Acidimicrobiales bacterium]
MSLLIGICGGSGSGKSTLANRIANQLRRRRGPSGATVLNFDAYYHDRFDLSVEERATINYDHPDALDHDLLIEHLIQLKGGRPVQVPIYDFATHCRSDEIVDVDATDVLVVEGILLFASARVRELLDLRVFRRCPEDIRFSRRIKRDIAERGRSLVSVEAQLTATVKPMHDQFVEPFADEADIVTDHGQDLDRITDEVVATIESLLASS